MSFNVGDDVLLIPGKDGKKYATKTATCSVGDTPIKVVGSYVSKGVYPSVGDTVLLIPGNDGKKYVHKSGGAARPPTVISYPNFHLFGKDGVFYAVYEKKAYRSGEGVVFDKWYCSTYDLASGPEGAYLHALDNKDITESIELRTKGSYQTRQISPYGIADIYKRGSGFYILWNYFVSYNAYQMESLIDQYSGGWSFESTSAPTIPGSGWMSFHSPKLAEWDGKFYWVGGTDSTYWEGGIREINTALWELGSPIAPITYKSPGAYQDSYWVNGAFDGRLFVFNTGWGDVWIERLNFGVGAGRDSYCLIGHSGYIPGRKIITEICGDSDVSLCYGDGQSQNPSGSFPYFTRYYKTGDNCDFCSLSTVITGEVV